MTQELDEKLCAKYPKIFVNRQGDMRTTAMCWGFECGDGWYNIIDRLCSHLQFNIDHNNRPIGDSDVYPYPQIIATQVKEKFGGLRFYTESATDRQYDVISFVESLSEHTCEKCGSMNHIGNTRGWIRTLCKECAKDEISWKEYGTIEQEVEQ